MNIGCELRVTTSNLAWALGGVWRHFGWSQLGSQCGRGVLVEPREAAVCPMCTEQSLPQQNCLAQSANNVRLRN